ncbi:MAG: PilZ domain-containing protein [Sandaracinaceae bacterium]|nr:PilZ domain-containing protein [Sandaracinaceae bacterium]
MSERREHRRHEVWFPVEVDVEDGRAIAVSYDVSSGGMLMAAGGSVDVGTELTVSFRVVRDGPEKRVKGRVIRVERNPASVDNRWRYKLALVFDEPQPEIEALVKSLG